MKQVALHSLLILLCLARACFAGGLVHVADGDCAGLQAASAASGSVDVVLANRGTYGYCPLRVTGTVAIDGQGARLQVTPAPNVAAIAVAAGAHLTLHHLNLVPTPAPIPPLPAGGGCGLWFIPPPCTQPEAAIFDNAGTLLLDTVSVADVDLNAGLLLDNRGAVSLRNTTLVRNRNGIAWLLPAGPAGTTLDIEQSTIAFNDRYALLHADASAARGTVRVSNSILQAPQGPVCDLPIGTGEFISGGGNVFSDPSCGAAPHDRIAADIRALDFGTHGGVVGNLALAYDSPAIGNGLPENCMATDARGFARGAQHCDSGAHEFGGGIGRLDASGSSGLYYNPSSNGHFVTVQRLGGDHALVIWNTFDRDGVPAWLYGVGTVSANTISVDAMAQNVGGTLLPGGDVVGVTPRLWGSVQVRLDDCYRGALDYRSLLPAFGSGTTTLQRLALLGGVDCSP